MSSPRYPKYKASGVEWLGEVPEHWEVKPLFGCAVERSESNKGMLLDNLLSLSYGRIIAKDLMSNDGLLPESFETYQIVRRGDIVFRLTDLQNDKRSLRSALVEEDGIITSAYLAVSPRGSNATFMAYLFRAYDLTKVFYSMGCGVRQTMNFADMKRLPTVIPPLPEQLAIAAFLDHETAKIDALVAEQERLIELLKEKRQAVISHAVTKGLNPDAPMKDSGIEWLGEVPEHWRIVPLKYVASHNNDALDETTHPDTEILYVDISGVDALDGIKIKEPMLFSAAPSRARRRVKDGDTIVSTVRTYLRAIARVRNPEINLIVSTGFAVVRPRADLSSNYAGNILTASYFIEQVIARSTGVSYPAINASELVQIPIAFPPLEEQTAIAAFLDHETAKFTTLTTEANRVIDLLKERRTALISAAVTGQIDVRNLVSVESA